MTINDEAQMELDELQASAGKYEFWLCEIATQKLLQRVGAKSALEVALYQVQKVSLPIIELAHPEIDWPQRMVKEIVETKRLSGRYTINDVPFTLPSSGFMNSLQDMWIYDQKDV